MWKHIQIVGIENSNNHSDYVMYYGSIRTFHPKMLIIVNTIAPFCLNSQTLTCQCRAIFF